MAVYLLHYVLVLLLLLGLDAVWLLTMVNRLYKPELGALLADGFRPVPAGIFYVIYAAGVLALVIMPALKSISTSRRKPEEAGRSSEKPRPISIRTGLRILT